MFGGPGNFSLDSALGLTGVWAPSTIWLVIKVAGLQAFFSLIARGHPAHASQTS